jgi:hypothetical protein
MSTRSKKKKMFLVRTESRFHFVVVTLCDSCEVRTESRFHFVVVTLCDSCEVEVNLRPTVSRPVCLGARRPSGTCDQFFFLLKISFRQLRFCYFVAPSLTIGRSVIYCTIASGPCVSHLRLPQPGGPGSHIYILQEQGGPVTESRFYFVV